MPRLIDLTGMTFTRLTVIERAPSRGPHSQWLCLCSCGERRVVRAQNLTQGTTRSCGCLGRESQRARMIARNTGPNAPRRKPTHGHFGTPTYHSWAGMIQRCLNPSNPNYRHYGGRRITVCERWRDFANFLSDMGEKLPGKSIDRIDVNGNYEPANCRWADAKQQANNTTANRQIEFGGERMNVSEWAEKIGVPRRTLHNRIFRLGWSVERALSKAS